MDSERQIQVEEIPHTLDCPFLLAVW